MLLRKLFTVGTLILALASVCTVSSLAQETPEEAKRRAAMEAERKAEDEKRKAIEGEIRRKEAQGNGGTESPWDSLSATISGRVADALGVPVAGATITASWDQAKAEAETGAARMLSQEVGLSEDDGTFRFICTVKLFKAVTSLDLTFTATHLDHLASEGKLFTLERNAEVKDLALSLRRAASISGRVTDSGGRPLPNATVIASGTDSSLQKGRPKEASLTRRTQTDGSGGYTVKGLVVGDYLLVAECPGYKQAAPVRKTGVRAGSAEQADDLAMVIMTAIVGKISVDEMSDYRTGDCSFYEGETCVKVCSLIVNDDKTFTIVDPPVGTFDMSIRWWRYASVKRTSVTTNEDQHTDVGLVEVEEQPREDLPND
jgi:protocatechuate 3,4-dioxygenase beta subunit